MCECFARCEADCVCDHDWTPPELTAARKRIAALEAERDQLRAELAAQSKLDCRTCFWYGNISEVCNRAGGAGRCGGIRHVSTLPIRLYEIDAAMAGGE